MDAIKEFLRINIDHDPPSALNGALCRKDRVVGSPFRSEAIAVLTECRVKYRLQHLRQCLLDQPIRHRRNAKLALAAVGFRDPDPPYRTGPVRPLPQLVAHRRPRCDQMTCSLSTIQTIHAGSPLVASGPLPGPLQLLSRRHRLKQRLPCAVVCDPGLHASQLTSSRSAATCITPARSARAGI